MSYRNDQLANLYDNDASGENLTYSPSEQNREFKYPDRVVRVVDPNTQTTSTGQIVNTSSNKNLELKRGYIRSIELPDTGSMNRGYNFHKKLNFQFNPALLTQNVSQNTTVLNFMQQSAADYARPMPGTVTTGFELFFDRSKELNEYRLSDESQIDLASQSPWEELGPQVIGVLHDLSLLFDIIGVGVSSKKKDDIIRGLTAEAIADVLATDASEEEEEAGLTEADRAAQAQASVESFVGLNVGNTAFLLPLPVRVVFSSLYIVEGFVKDITVTFTKFTHSMVPMQCTVGLMFEAKYIGFAKQDTFLTTSLATALSQEPSDALDVETEITDEHLSILKSDLSKLKVVVVTGDGDSEWGDKDYDFTDEVSAGAGLERDVSSIYSLISNKIDYFGIDVYKFLEEADMFLKVVTYDSGFIQNKLVEGSSINVSFDGTFVRAWRYSQEFVDGNRELFSKAQEARTRLINNNIGDAFNNVNPYTLSTDETYRSALKNIATRLRSTFEGAGGNVNTGVQRDDTQGDERLYNSVTKLFSLQMTDSKAYSSGDNDGYVTATTLGQWNAMRNGRAVAGKFVNTSGTGPYYDRAIDGDKDNRNHNVLDDVTDRMHYAIEYKLVVNVYIEDKGPYRFEQWDYVMSNMLDNATADSLNVFKTFNIDWESQYNDTNDDEYISLPPGNAAYDEDDDDDSYISLPPGNAAYGP